MATRQTYSSASPPPVTGPNFADNVAAHVKRLYDAAAFPLTAVGGTANAVTATLDPVLDGSGLVNGMRFGITWGTTNTGAMTLAINGGSAVAVVDASGGAMTAGVAVAGTRALLEYVSGSFRVMSAAGGAAGGVARYYQAFTASGTFAKPAGLDDDTMVFVEGWGAGGGGGGQNGGGGGGGAYACRWMRLGDIPSSVAVTIGTGGTGGTGGNGTAGGSTTFGALMTAFGGGRGGGGASTGAGGTGAGLFSAGGNASGATSGVGVYGGGASGASRDAVLPSGGGNGGAGAGTGAGATGGQGGHSERGGGGGGGTGLAAPGAGGRSLIGGNGGAGTASGAGVAGTAPGGGGGGAYPSGQAGGAGARGELRIWI